MSTQPVISHDPNMDGLALALLAALEARLPFLRIEDLAGELAESLRVANAIRDGAAADVPADRARSWAAANETVASWLPDRWPSDLTRQADASTRRALHLRVV